MGNTKYIAFSGETTGPEWFVQGLLVDEAHSPAVCLTVGEDAHAAPGRVSVIGHVCTDSIGGGDRVLRFLESYLAVGRVWFTDIDYPSCFMAHRNEPYGTWQVWDLTGGLMDRPPLTMARLVPG